jgi:hypothetical protein
MGDKLYKVNVEVDVYVMAESLGDAAKIAKHFAGDEVPEFSKAHASEVSSLYEIPEDWKNQIPYSKNGNESRTCFTIMKEQPKEEIKQSQTSMELKPEPETINIEVTPENVEQEEELPVELPKQKDDLPPLRFKI